MDFIPQEEFIGDGVRFDRSHSDNLEKEERILFPLASGAIAGLIAVAPMTIALLIGQKLTSGRARPLPPEKVTKGMLEKFRLNDKVPPYSKKFETVFSIGHLGYGIVTGSIYGLFSRWLPKVNPALKGAGFGLLVWALSYPGWIPAVGFWRKSAATSKRNNFTLIFSHLIWGLGLSLADLIQERKDRI